MNQNYEIHEYRGIIKEYQPNINHNLFPTVQQINKIFSNRDDNLTNGFRIVLENPKTLTDITFLMSHAKAIGVATDIDASDLRYHSLVQIQGTHNPVNNLYTAIGMQKYVPNENSLQNNSLMSLTLAQQQQSVAFAKNNRQAHKKVIDIVRSSAARSARSMTVKLKQNPNLQQSMYAQSSSAISFVHRSVPAPIPIKSSSASGFSINNISNKLGNFASHLKSRFKNKRNNKNNTFTNKDDSVMPRKGSREYLKSSASVSVSASMRNSMRASLSKSIMDSVHSVKSTPNTLSSSSLSSFNNNSSNTNSVNHSKSVKPKSSKTQRVSSTTSESKSSVSESISSSVSNVSLDANAIAQSESIAQTYSTKLNQIFDTSGKSSVKSGASINSNSIDSKESAPNGSNSSASNKTSSTTPKDSAITSIQSTYNVPLSAATLKYTLIKQSLSSKSVASETNKSISSSNIPHSSIASSSSNIKQGNSTEYNNTTSSSTNPSSLVNSNQSNYAQESDNSLSNQKLSSMSLKSDARIKKAYLSIVNNKHITKAQMQDALRDVDRLEGWDDFFAKDEKNFMHQLNDDLDRILTNSGVTYPLSYNNIPNVSLFKRALSTGKSNKRSNIRNDYKK